MLKIEHLAKGFQYLYSRNYNDKGYKFNYTPKTLSTGEKFLTAVSKKIPLSILGPNYLQRYLAFQDEYWSGLKLTYSDGRVTFPYIFGITPLNRFYSRDRNYDYQFDGKLSLKEISSWFETEIIQLKQEYTNPLRAMHLNTDKGLVFCIDHTTLYDSLDQSCIACKEKDTCKKLLATNYPNIYLQRGYGKRIK